MSLLLESIRIEGGRVMNPGYHIRRMRLSAARVVGEPGADFPGNFIPDEMIPPTGVHKCRVIYDSGIVSVEVSPYVQRKITSLKIVEAPAPDYSFKYADRSQIDALFALRDDCDDILIVTDGLVTDTSYCNVAFEKDGKWFTPAKPLLHGTMRQCLIDNGIVLEEDIHISDIGLYQRIRMFNAMIPWERANTVTGGRCPVAGSR